MEIRFGVGADDVAGASGDRLDIVSEYHFVEPPSEPQVVTGRFDWGEDEFAFAFHLEHSASTLRLRGPGPITAESVSGISDDPDQAVFPAGCSVETTATHISPTPP